MAPVFNAQGIDEWRTKIRPQSGNHEVQQDGLTDLLDIARSDLGGGEGGKAEESLS